MVHEIGSVDDYNNQLKNAGEKLVVIDFHAKWCGPCKRIAPLIDQLADELKDKVVFLKANVDELDDLVSKYKVQVMPTFVAIRKGETLDTYSGSDEDKLTEFVKKHAN